MDIWICDCHFGIYRFLWVSCYCYFQNFSPWLHFLIDFICLSQFFFPLGLYLSWKKIYICRCSCRKTGRCKGHHCAICYRKKVSILITLQYLKEFSKVFNLVKFMYLAVQIVETVWTEKLTMKIVTPMISSFLYVKPVTNVNNK